MIDLTGVNPPDATDEVTQWHKRVEAADTLYKKWEKEYRIAENYQYWKGRQRAEEFDPTTGERRAQHNKVHPFVDETLPALYFYNPYGRVVAAPERSDTPGETVSEKARLLQDTGMYLVHDKKVGFKENTQLGLKEAQWAVGCVEVGYSPDFIDNPAAARPPLKEKKDTKLPTTTFGTPIMSEMESVLGPEAVMPGTDEMGLSVGEGSDLPSLIAELKRLKQSLRGETFFVRHIQSRQILISTSDKPVLEDNDWVGYWQEYPLEDVKRCAAYENTDDLKAEGELAANLEEGTVDRVRLFRIWDLRTKEKLVFAKNHKKMLARIPFERCPLKFYRSDIDPYHFMPVPPIYLKLDSQDQYNDSAEYLRKMRVATVPRFTYDQDAVEADEAAKFQSRDMNIMIPRKGGTRQPIEAVNQPSTAAGAIQTLALSDKEFTEASSASGDPLNPPTQTATRVVVANAKISAQESYQRNKVAEWLASIIEELILLAVENMNLETWIAVNVDLDSPYAQYAAGEVARTYEMINAERLRSSVTGIAWHIEVEADSLSPVSEAEKGNKLMQMLGFISTPQGAALMSQAPKLLKRLMTLAGITAGEDVDAIKEALMVIVAMNQAQAMAGTKPPGVSPSAGEQAGPTSAPPPPPGMPEVPLPVPSGTAGA